MLDEEYPLIFARGEGFKSKDYSVEQLRAREDELQLEIDRLRGSLGGSRIRSRKRGEGRAPVQVSQKPSVRLLPMTPIDARYKIRFAYRCAGIPRVEQTPGCPTLKTYKNGDRELEYRDGTRVVFHGTDKFTFFPNGDRSHEFEDGAAAYFYAEDGTVDFRHPDGTKVVQFRNGRRDFIRPDGTTKTTYHMTAMQFRD